MYGAVSLIPLICVAYDTRNETCASDFHKNAISNEFEISLKRNDSRNKTLAAYD